MAQMQELIRYLTAAGSAMAPESRDSYLLFTNEDSSLICKRWSGSEFNESEIIAEKVRPNSSATYFLTDSTRIVFCISEDSTLRALKYDPDEEDWVDVEGTTNHKVHPESHVAGFIGPDHKRHVIFQDSSSHLVCLDESMALTSLPVDAVPGTPITTTFVKTLDGGIQMLVFYFGHRQTFAYP
ncbi:hypothetical protein K435DRAFT_786561 [Dendrothele bispora CBS 962.96]|uniref:Fucose-specific lectin n=1 Tax=Dendrothele bispora (strain CBS 962.96) TaxID=1314807 RepID=A0A4S8KQA0_DENBC|nr:hypothetical protein K435DRAFT_786561 [Dendrothele bispora CBS 962.96]